MTAHSRWLLPLLFVTLAACSTSKGLDRAAIQEALRDRRAVAAEVEPASTAGHQAAPIPPFRLGLYFVRTQFPTRQYLRTIEWLSQDKEALVNSLSPLRDAHVVQEIVPLADSASLTPSRQELRQAAMRYGIDVLAVVDGIGAVDRYNNAYAFLYPTLLGAYMAPGTVIDALFIIDGLLWDLRNDRILDRPTAEGEGHRVGAVIMIEDTEALKEAQGRAIERFGESLVSRLRSFQRERETPSPRH